MRIVLSKYMGFFFPFQLLKNVIRISIPFPQLFFLNILSLIFRFGKFFFAQA